MKAKMGARYCFALASIILSLLFTKTAFAAKITNDRYASRQWWLQSDGTNATIGADINIVPFWMEEKAEWPDISIGVLDTGVNSGNEDLKSNLRKGYDFIQKTDRLRKMLDKDGHGSFIAGLIAAKANNRKGIAGMSRKNNLQIVPLRFNLDTSQAVKAIRYAQGKRIKIINTSWGSEEYDQPLYDTIRDYDGLVVAAAGNDGQNHDTQTHFYPCDFDLPNIICVGASNENGTIAGYSDLGSTVDILAPGGEEAELLSIKKNKKNTFVSGIGTSYATAFVSGTAGLMLSKNPSLSVAEIKSTILENARKKDELAGKISSGGILDVAAALNDVP